MLLVGVDDTDSRQGGCTTSLAAAVVALFPELSLDGPPRLVRLNPNVPWKTRGNAAVALRFAGGVPLDDALARVDALVRREAQVSEGTEPGVAVADRPLPAWLYDAAVSRIVERSEAEQALKESGAQWSGGRGVIGAAAALAWPAQRTTWELIAYREPAQLGAPREVDDAWAREVEWGYPTTFDTYDLVERETVAVPSGPDPVLWGLRGEDPAELHAASAVMGPERPARETLFLTNQGTDDHLRDKRVADARAFDSARLRVRVQEKPVDHHGHVFVRVADDTGEMRAAAYAPTRSFRRLVRHLAPGDEVTLAGGVKPGPDGQLTLGIEKMLVHKTTPRKAGNPLCPACGRAMKSAGKDAGFRCRECGTRSAEPRLAPGPLQPGWYEVPASARRHLAMPLKRMPPPS